MVNYFVVITSKLDEWALLGHGRLLEWIQYTEYGTRQKLLAPGKWANASQAMEVNVRHIKQIYSTHKQFPFQIDIDKIYSPTPAHNWWVGECL